MTSLIPRKNFFTESAGSRMIQLKDGRQYTVRNNRKRFFFPDEWMIFYDNLKKSQKPTFNILLNTGARINEIRHIKVNDIDFVSNRIILRITKRVVDRPKAGRLGERNIRIIGINKKFANYLKNIIKEYKLKNDDVLPVLTTSAANKAMKKSLIKSRIEDYIMFSIHNIRKTTETWMIALGADSFKVVKRFGHSAGIALKHYYGGDAFSFQEKTEMKEILGETTFE